MRSGITAGLVALACACSWPVASLDGKRCPCASGYVCAADGVCHSKTSSSSTPTFIQANAAQGITTCAIPFASGVGAGNLIVVAAGWATAGSGAPATVTDTHGNAYESAVGPTPWVGGLPAAYRAQIFYAKNVASGPDTVTLTIAVAEKASVDFCLLYIHEYSGLALDSPLDQTSVASGPSTQPPDSGARTTTFGAELVFGFALSGDAISGPGDGFVRRALLSDNLTEDKIVSSAGSYSASFANSNNTWIALMATFKASGL